MTGDQHDMVARLRAVLPTRWFPDDAPVLDCLLSGLASGWSWAYQLLQYVRAQTRIGSATDVWLDLIAHDFFGSRLTRRSDQADNAFRRLIQRELFRERGTRGAIVSVLQDLTGRTPLVFEPARPADTGGYGSLAGKGGGVGYSAAGGWGSLLLPFQCFVTVYRPIGSGIAMVNGWGGPAGGYGRGTLEYASLDMVQGQVTDDDIYTAVANVLPAATIGWTRITN
jgi:hypothetical protein